MKMRKVMEHRLSILVIFALIFANVSPACAFVSGKGTSLLEICTAEGVRTISVDFSVSDEDTGTEHGYAPASDCNFCFNQSLAKTFFDGAYSVSTLLNFDFSCDVYEADQPKKVSNHVYIARAPPIFL